MEHAAKFADDTKLGDQLICKGSSDVQKDLDRWKEWADESLMKFSLSLQTWNPVLGRQSPGQRHRLGMDRQGNSSVEKTLGALASSNQSTSHPHTLASTKASSILSSTNSRVASRLREVTITFCSAIIKPHLDTASSSLPF